ncbi:MAG TPA: S41 family peptidase [Polyangiaceae bacterium]|nr:S41 family peptidase [Polyangiaceae bacterium]
MRRVSFLPLLLVASCSQAPAGTPPPAGAVANATAAAAPASPVPASEATVPPEPFANAAQNFDAARKALLGGYYRDSLTEDDLYRAAVRGMVEYADPSMRQWNKMLAPAEVAQLRLDLQGELVGIGVKIDFDPATGYIDVKGTIPGSPAEHAGIAPPDKIVTVDGKLYKGRSMTDVVGDIRGKAGDTVTLSILRGASLVTVPIVRAKVAYDIVQDLVVADDVGYVRIPSFNAKTPGSLHDALTDLAGKHVRAIVLDLRANPGGSFDDCVAAAGELAPAGATIASVNKRGKVEPIAPKAGTPAPMLLDVPLAVLVDHDTASSAELLAAAVQELRHATLVGARTHGKWSVQRLEDLPNGYAIKFTVGLFASPSGKSYDGTGLGPDVEVDAASDAVQRALAESDPKARLAEDVQLRTAVAVLARH